MTWEILPTFGPFEVCCLVASAPWVCGWAWDPVWATLDEKAETWLREERLVIFTSCEGLW